MEETEGIVLRTYDLRETSKIVVFYTREFGTLKGIAKGVRAKNKSFGNSLELFCHNYIAFYKSRNSSMHLLGKCEIKNFYTGIREDLLKTALATYWMEIIRELAESPDEELFEFLLNNLSYIENEDSIPPIIIPFLELNLLKLAGYGPVLDHCVNCKKEPASSKFSPNLGGLLCPSCYSKDKIAIDVSTETISLMKFLAKTSIENIPRIKISGRSLGQLRGVIHYFLFHSIGKRPKSLQFLEKMMNPVYTIEEIKKTGAVK
jgi:DNA repair protein RecO (recombination protein O)